MGAPEGGPRTHQALIVTIEDCDWLADAGFPGPAPIAPLRIDTKEQQIVGHDVFRLRADPASGELVLERKNEDEWFAVRQLHYGVRYQAVNQLCYPPLLGGNGNHLPRDHAHLDFFNSATRPDA